MGAGVTIANKMSGILLKIVACAFLLILLSLAPLSAQTAIIDNIPDPGPQELSEGDNIPVLIKHLPDWEKVKDKAILVSNSAAFSKAVGDQPSSQAAQAVVFTTGTEAVVADYEAGKLAIVEFTTPQMAADADAKIQAKLGETPGPAYRRVGNYAVFVFNPRDEASAAALIDQIKYEKIVTWMGSDPVQLKKLERSYIETTSDVVLGAIQITGYIILITATIGGLAGFFVFRVRNRQRTMADSYTDAGGMTRLNLDDFSTSSSPDRFLNK